MLEYFYCNAILHVTPEILRRFILDKEGILKHFRRWKAVKLRVSVIPFTGPPFDAPELLRLSAGLGVELYVERMPPIERPLDQALKVGR